MSFISAADEFAQSGTVGPPTPLSEMRLESVPELNYDALDPVEPKVRKILHVCFELGRQALLSPSCPVGVLVLV